MKRLASVGNDRRKGASIKQTPPTGATARLTWTTQAISVAELLAGAMLSWGLAYWWLGNLLPLAGAAIVSVVVHAISWRVRGQIRGLWLTVFGFCATLSKVDPELSTAALGDMRLLVIVGGSIMALAYGLLVEEPAALRNLLSRPG